MNSRRRRQMLICPSRAGVVLSRQDITAQAWESPRACPGPGPAGKGRGAMPGVRGAEPGKENRPIPELFAVAYS
jgi:hypothetical protein